MFINIPLYSHAFANSFHLVKTPIAWDLRVSQTEIHNTRIYRYHIFFKLPLGCDVWISLAFYWCSDLGPLHPLPPLPSSLNFILTTLRRQFLCPALLTAHNSTRFTKMYCPTGTHHGWRENIWYLQPAVSPQSVFRYSRAEWKEWEQSRVVVRARSHTNSFCINRFLIPHWEERACSPLKDVTHILWKLITSESSIAIHARHLLRFVSQENIPACILCAPMCILDSANGKAALWMHKKRLQKGRALITGLRSPRCKLVCPWLLRKPGRPKWCKAHWHERARVPESATCMSPPTHTHLNALHHTFPRVKYPQEHLFSSDRIRRVSLPVNIMFHIACP